MSENDYDIPDRTIEIIARNFFKESSRYGFVQMDYLRLVNVLLDVSMSESNTNRIRMERKKEDPNPKPTSLPLEGNRIKIRQFTEKKDKKILVKWLADKSGRYFLLSRISAVELKPEKLFQDDTNILGIITLHDETPIGAVAFLNYNPCQHKAELRKMIGDPEMRGRGFAKEATSLWIHYGFTSLGLKKIYLNTLNTNIRNIKLNQELGFKVEGILRNEVFFDGEYHDVLRMGFCRE